MRLYRSGCRSVVGEQVGAGGGPGELHAGCVLTTRPFSSFKVALSFSPALLPLTTPPFRPLPLQLLAPKYFLKWKQRHQAKYRFSTAGLEVRPHQGVWLLLAPAALGDVVRVMLASVTASV